VQPGEDGSKEFRVRVASAAQVSDNGSGVERHSAMRDGQLIAVIVQQQPVRHAGGTRQPGAAGVEGADAADEAIGRGVSMAADDDVSTASGEQPPWSRTPRVQPIPAAIAA
jgi:hypothetical protein